MASIEIPEVTVNVLDADATGFLDVDDGSGIYPGALAWLFKNDGSVSSRLKVVKTAGNRLWVRVFPGNDEAAPPSFGYSNVSAYATVSRLCQERQVVRVNPDHTKASIG